MRYLVFVFILFISQVAFSQEVPVSDTTAAEIDSSQVDDMRNMMPATSDDGNLIDTESQTQDISGLLQSSRDVFNSVAGYNFSSARFKIRGYGSEKYIVMMNGVEMNNPENNWAIWSLWGGLNDITRYQNVKNGISASQQDFGGIGGSSNIEIRASQLRKTTKLSYALSNSSHRHRVIFTESTGLMENGWAITFSGSMRYAKEGYVQGTSYSAASYFLAIEKKIGKRHSLGLTGFGAPRVSGRKGLATQEAYDLMGDNYYNPFWGYQTNAATGEREK
ncbi:MAG: TonB-dependent receptor, partial [Flavobacteriales bacterium]|nr:TonB-dependent receptor [Flavobacteriales bacterium]